MSVQLTATAAYKIARDFTEKAIENNYFKPKENSKETAKDITDFYHAIVESMLKGE